MRPLRLCAPFLLLAACAAPPESADDVPVPAMASPEDAMFRDFTKGGKVDEAGHPVNAVVVEAEEFCNGRGNKVAGGWRSDKRSGTVCFGKLPKLPGGDMVVNVRLRPLGVDTGSKKDVVRVTLQSPAIQRTTFTGRSFRRDGQWAFIPMTLDTFSDEVTLRIETFGRGAVEIDYIEIFTNEFPVAITPGSRVFHDDELVSIEGPRGGDVPGLMLDGNDLDLAGLVSRGLATRTDTSYRSVYSVSIRQLANGRMSDLDLFVRAARDAEPTARVHVYRSAPACDFVGDPQGKRVLLTGFHPFPVAETHPNVSSVAVFALDRQVLRGAQVMRLSIPVEYDDAPAIVADAIARCAPDVVIDFGQGGGTISLEHTAYNLKDTGRFADNRGRYQAGVPIEEDGPAELKSALPLPAIKRAVEGALGRLPVLDVSVVDSEDPGRYICNNTFYAAVTATKGTATKAGFIHLPYTTKFDDASTAAWGELIRAIVEAAVEN